LQALLPTTEEMMHDAKEFGCGGAALFLLLFVAAVVV
jgi:hypothetical protein